MVQCGPDRSARGDIPVDFGGIFSGKQFAGIWSDGSADGFLSSNCLLADEGQREGISESLFGPHAVALDL